MKMKQLCLFCVILFSVNYTSHCLPVQLFLFLQSLIFLLFADEFFFFLRFIKTKTSFQFLGRTLPLQTKGKIKTEGKANSNGRYYFQPKNQLAPCKFALTKHNYVPAIWGSLAYPQKTSFRYSMPILPKSTSLY